MRARVAYFTLLEVMIAMAVLALMAGVVSFNVRGLYYQQEALDEMNRVGNLLRSAQELMMLTHLDSEVRFDKKEEAIFVWLSPISTPVFESFPKLAREPLVLKHIESVTFDNAINDTISKDQFALPFISKGFVMYPGVLELKGRGATRSIVFSGSPAPIALQTGRSQFPFKAEYKDYIERVIQQTDSDAPALMIEEKAPNDKT